MINEDRVLIDKVRSALNKEFVRRSLIRYFTEKGFDNFKGLVYPAMIMDLPYRIPELVNKVEIVPYVQELNPATGQAVIGWNLYALGTHRMSLGDSSHNNMNEFQRAQYGPTPNSIATGQKSAEEVVEFVVKIISANKSGMIKPQPVTAIPQPQQPKNIVNRPAMGPTASGGYYERSR